MDTTDLRLEYLKPFHAPALVELYREVFGKVVRPSYFLIKYKLANAELPQCSTVAFDGDRIIGFYGCVTSEFYDFQRKIAASIGSVCDFILLESYRGKKVFDQLYEFTLAKCQDEELECLYGFQSEQTWKVSSRFGWTDGRHFSRFQLRFRSLTAARFRKKWSGETGILRRLNKALAPYYTEADLDRMNRYEGRFSHRYDAAYFQGKPPEARYLVYIEGVTLWLKYNGSLSAGFIRFSDGCDLPAALDRMYKVLRPTGICDLNIHVQQGSQEYERLASVLSPKESYNISYIRLRDDGCTMDEVVLNYMDVDTF